MAKGHKPRCGSKAFYPRKRATRQHVSMKSFAKKEEAKLLVSVVGISIILSQLIGPLMLRFGIKRCISEKTKFNLLSVVEDPLVEV